MCVRESVRERVWEIVCVRKTERESEGERERERERERQSPYVNLHSTPALAGGVCVCV